MSGCDFSIVERLAIYFAVVLIIPFLIWSWLKGADDFSDEVSE